MKILVAYYSRSGITERVARDLAGMLGAEVEEIIDPTDRSGTIGYLKSVWHVVRHKDAPIRPPEHDPSTYDLVVIGTPVWGRGISLPVRTYLSQVHMLLPNVAFFCTMKGSGDTSTLESMADQVGKTPLAQIAFTETDIKKGAYKDELEAFANVLKSAP